MLQVACKKTLFCLWAKGKIVPDAHPRIITLCVCVIVCECLECVRDGVGVVPSFMRLMMLFVVCMCVCVFCHALCVACMCVCACVIVYVCVIVCAA